MAEPTKDSPNTVSLEELLRFKRAERPDQNFWKEFDSELHQRMMQTLVKKDSWPVQLLRGLSGKFAQTTAIAAAAAVLALMVIRPAFVTSSGQSQPALASTGIEQPERAESSAVDLEVDLMADADYKTERLLAAVADSQDVVTQDYGLDHIEVTSYDSDAYSADMALSGFTSTGVASLVY